MEHDTEIDSINAKLAALDLQDILDGPSRWHPSPICWTSKAIIGEIDGKQVLIVLTNDPDEME